MYPSNPQKRKSQAAVVLSRPPVFISHRPFPCAFLSLRQNFVTVYCSVWSVFFFYTGRCAIRFLPLLTLLSFPSVCHAILTSVFPLMLSQLLKRRGCLCTCTSSFMLSTPLKVSCRISAAPSGVMIQVYTEIQHTTLSVSHWSLCSQVI